MRQPTIKKYRRRVSDERVERAARECAKTHGYNPDERVDHPNNRAVETTVWHIYITSARAALEADAEVVEAHVTPQGFMSYLHVGKSKMQAITVSAEQFHAEWEEIL